MTDLKTLTGKVCDLCHETASYVREQAELLTQQDEEEKGKQNLVTYVDRTAEKMLVEGLSDILPGAGFIAEEKDYGHSGQGYAWVIDPLDGTTNFIHGLPLYSISVGLIRDDEVLAGVVFHIPANECYSAWLGGGAFLDGKPIQVSSRESLEHSLVVTGFPYSHEGKLERYLEIFRELVVKTRGVRRLGSAAIDLCYVSAGRMEAFYEYGLNAWDVAAGSIILREAGGRVTDFHGEHGFLFGKELLATNGKVHRELQEIIARHFN